MKGVRGARGRWGVENIFNNACVQDSSGINFSPEIRMLFSSGHRESIFHTTRVLWPLSGDKKRAGREGL